MKKKPSATQNTAQSKKSKRASYEKKTDKIYFRGVVVETLPGVKFKVKIERSKGLEPLILECQTRTLLKVKRVKIVLGDEVEVEIDPQDISKGLVVARY